MIDELWHVYTGMAFCKKSCKWRYNATFVSFPDLLPKVRTLKHHICT